MVPMMSPPKVAGPEQRTKAIRSSGLRDMFTLVTRPNILSFALGLPALELFPLAECRAAATQALADPKALQYNIPSQALKRHIQGLMASRGVTCSEEQIFLTGGGQQAIHLLINLLLHPGQQVLVEELAYEGFHLALQTLQPQVVTVPTTPQNGLNVDAIEARLARGGDPAFLYTIPENHNPLGVSLSEAARTRLVGLARRFRVPIIEDDVYGFLNYDGTAAAPMRALDDEWVFYIGSFSKILTPALRVGWIVAPAAVTSSLSRLKQATDLDVCTFGQLTALAYLDAGHLPSHLASIRGEYRIRRDAMLGALESHFPREARWHKPDGGMFLWVELPPEIDTVALLRLAVDAEQVAFMPGPVFANPDQPCSRNGIRLNFTHCSPESIEDGIARLARCLRTVCNSSVSTASHLRH
jgi:2-aminoadipate transaminase